MKLQDLDFRIWNNEDATYEHPSNIIIILQDKYSGKDVSKYSIELFTGLIGKNDKKIYEGDILSIYDSGDFINCSVFYNKDEARFVDIVDDEEDDLPWYSDIEVVGNIHENKDLLKE